MFDYVSQHIKYLHDFESFLDLNKDDLRDKLKLRELKQSATQKLAGKLTQKKQVIQQITSDHLQHLADTFDASKVKQRIFPKFISDWFVDCDGGCDLSEQVM